MRGPHSLAAVIAALGALLVSASVPAMALTPAGILTMPISDTAPNATQLRRGQYLVIAGDCMSCHVRPGGEPLAGGLAMNTPFGVLYSANITPDPQTGIGTWTAAQFYRAMHDGIDDQGQNLYPAFPYPWFRLASREDDDAILAFLKTVPPVNYTPPANELPFPMNLRVVAKLWNWMFLAAGGFAPNTAESVEWNRGA